MTYELTPIAYLWDNGKIKIWLDGPKLPIGVNRLEMRLPGQKENLNGF